MKGDQLLDSILNQQYRLSTSSSQLLVSIMEEQSIENGFFLSKTKRLDRKEYVLLNGVCRSYVLNPEGKEMTLSFYVGPEIISPNVSRASDGISHVNLQVLSDAIVVVFSSDKLMELMVANREIREWGNVILQSELKSKVERELSLATATAKERLIAFRNRFASLENILPHPIIASYLGITNVSFSRLRKELMND
ncbi:MAG: Crp/Fnr family transcriptional regulator [Reichenbachiella sp.]